MSSTHTPGRLTVIGVGLYSGDPCVDGFHVASFHSFGVKGATEANVRRAAACWNACLTLPTEIIEQGLAESLMRAKEIGRDETHAELVEHLQAAIDALAATETYLLERLSSNPGSTGSTVILPLIRRAIEGAGVAPTQSSWGDCP